ncbi:MAG: ATP-grasp domain-containing protein [Vicinamibacterales bacterium]
MLYARLVSCVVVTGVGGPAGRAAATYFAEKGYRVIGTDMREVTSPSWAFRLVPAAREPAFPRALLAVAVDEGAALVLPTVTEELPVVARMRPELRDRGIALSVSDPPGVDVANDKLLTAQELGAKGVAVPRTFAGTTPCATVAAALGFPLLSKPRFGRGGRGVVVHRTMTDLSRAGQEEIVWQAFLPGEEFDVNLFVERGDHAPTVTVLRKVTLKEGLVGNALSVERVSRPDVAALGLRAARVLALEGPLDMDIRLGHDGAPAVLDVNARVGANVLSAREVMDALDDAWRNGRCA